MVPKIIQKAVAKLLQLPLLPKTAILLSLLFATMKGAEKVNQILQDSLIIKERLTKFDEIQGNLETCWTSLRQLTLYLGCLTNDEKIMADVTFFLSSCYLQQQELPPIKCHNSIPTIFCIPPTCPQKCAIHHSERFSKQIGFNAFDVIYAGIQKFCSETPKVENSEIWKMRVPWDQIAITLTETEENALIMTNADNQRTNHLKQILWDLLQTEEVRKPLKFVKANLNSNSNSHGLRHRQNLQL